MSGKITGEIILYQPDDTIRLEVMIENETVWLTQAQIAQLFGTEIPAISKHINNIYKVGELDKVSTVSILEIVRQEGERFVQRKVAHYNLDMILSVGYRVNSINATLFRRWATRVLKEYLLRGVAINQRFEQIEQRVAESEKKINFLVKASFVHDESRLRNEIRELKQYIEAILADFNDVNEDTRMQLELICKELAELQTKNNWIGLN